MSEEEGFKVVEEGPIVPVSEGSAVSINVVSINGTEMFDVRKLYKKKGETKWLPTKKGLTLPCNNDGYKALREVFRFAKSKIKE